jgi:hypothetical protein
MLVGEIIPSRAKEHKDYLRGRKAMPDTTIDGIDTAAADGLVLKLMDFYRKGETKLCAKARLDLGGDMEISGGTDSTQEERYAD